ncbi:MAG TPA: protease inhibitor I9 family protein, partial [Acidimicrobiia bacterium]|nr:protease inhibitor I9 family protein [Acidimicrobiia bacterium]
MRRWRLRGGLAVAVLACLGGWAPVVASSAERSNYIVQLRAEPLATGLAREGKLDPTSPDAVDYQRRLDELELGALRAAEIGDDLVGYRYRTTLAGFSAQLTERQAERLRGLAGVAAVTADRIRSYGPRPQTGDEQVAADASPAAAAPTATSPMPTAS